MEKLRAYLNAMSVAEQIDFAMRCGTTIGYLRKAMATHATPGARLAVAIERESGGSIRVEQLDPATDWAVVRSAA